MVPRTCAGSRGARRGRRAGTIRGDSPFREKDRQERYERHRLFLSKGMLPEAWVKSRVHAELASAIGVRDQMTKQKVQYINKVHAMFNGHGVKIKRNSLTSKVGFERTVKSREWSRVERATLEAMTIQLEAIRKSLKVLDTEIAALAETLPGYKNLISIKGIGMLSAATFLAAIGDVKDFPKPGNLAAYLDITPRISQSNDTQLVGRITKRGNKAACARLARCALIAVKYSPYLKKLGALIKMRYIRGISVGSQRV